MLYTYLLHTGNAKCKIQGKTGKIICTWFLFFCDWDEYVLLSVVMYDKVCTGRGNSVGVVQMKESNTKPLLPSCKDVR